MKKIGTVLLLAGLLFSSSSYAQIDSVKLQEWRAQKFSMFIHFGLYSQLGGVWDGKNIDRGLSEQIQAHAGIYSDTYADVAKQFNPVGFNADSIVSLAKAAGMKSIVITSKHHDGFCMFKTNTTDFNIVEATPFGRDVLKELSAACKHQGIRFALYFSLIDWHYPQASPISSHNSDYITPEHHEYNKKQITELLSNYGEVSELWFDMGSQSVAQSKEMRELVHRLQPNCMIGSRIGNDMGDFTVMGDNQEPDYAIGVPWQSPASFFDETWGYRSWQNRGSDDDKYKEKLTSLIRVASRGGNYLLNIGPKDDGTVVPFENDILRRMGAWLNKNSEAVYGAGMDPFHVSFPWGSITSRSNKLYLFILQQPENNSILLPGIKGQVTKSYVLGEDVLVKTSSNTAGLKIQLPPSFTVSDEYKVVALDFPKGFTVPPPNILPLTPNGVSLNKFNGFNYYSNSTVDYNTSYTSVIKQMWTLNATQSGNYLPQLFYTNEEKGRAVDLVINGSKQTVELDGDAPNKLNNDLTSIKWGTMYLQGPLYSGLGGTHASLQNIDVNKPWPNENDGAWGAHAEWSNGNTYSLSAGMMNAYYVLQGIDTDSAQTAAVEVTSGDALMVFLNGQELYIHNNPLKKDSIKHTIILPLRAGKNQLAVKLFNHFHKKIYFNINYSIPQVFYSKKLIELKVVKGKNYPVSWQLHNPATPHEDMGMPGLRLQFSAQQ